MPKRAKTVSLLSVSSGLLLVVFFALVYREEIEAWVQGYKVIWLEEGVTPTSIGKLFGRNDYIAVNVVDVVDEFGGSRAGRWSVRSGSWSLLPSASGDQLPWGTLAIKN